MKTDMHMQARQTSMMSMGYFEESFDKIIYDKFNPMPFYQSMIKDLLHKTNILFKYKNFKKIIYLCQINAYDNSYDFIENQFLLELPGKKGFKLIPVETHDAAAYLDSIFEIERNNMWNSLIIIIDENYHMSIKFGYDNKNIIPEVLGKKIKIYREGYYDAINDMEITDVFQNFENKYGSDDTTELTSFKDMKQKDTFPPHGKERGNLFKAVHERDKNIGISPLGEVITHSIANSALRNNEKNLAESLFIEGYLAALDEACNCGISCNEEEEFIQGYYDAIEECGDCCGEECCNGKKTTLKKKIIDSIDGKASKISQQDANRLAVNAYDYDKPIDNHYIAFEEGYIDALLDFS